VLDGLGPIGEHDHSDREYMLKDSLLQRCRLLAASILELDRLALEAPAGGAACSSTSGP